MKQFILLLTVAVFSVTSFAQAPVGGPTGAAPRQAPPSIGTVFGRLVDSTGKGVSDASVMILHSRFDTVTKKNKDILLKGISSQGNGDFSFEDLPIVGKLTLKISATGYKPIEQIVSFQPAGGRPNAGGAPAGAMGAPEKDLGKIVMHTDAQQLAAVVVTGSSNRLKMDIDKKVFSVDQNLVSAGGTAVDVMKNVPSVNVDLDGNVSLRNAPPQIFVDGRPTMLTLEQIPADAIETIEVITNPSAKYDASGGGAGILNIVLKKNRKTGYNGNLRAGVDKLGAINSGVDFNVRQNKVNVFGSLNYNQRKTNTIGTVERTNLLDTPQTVISQTNEDLSTGRFIFGRAGLDYFVTNRLTLSLAGFRVNGKFNPGEAINIFTDSLYNGGTIRSFSDRTSEGTREFNGRGLSFGLKQLFEKKGREWTADANYFSGNMDIYSLYTTNKYNHSSNSIESTQMQKLLGSGSDYNLILQTDYVDPITDKIRLDAGVRAAVRGRENINNNYFFDYLDNEYVLIPSTSSNYKNKDNVYAAYASITANVNKNFGYMLGLRAESSDYTGELTETGEQFSNKYPISLFPSLFVSQKIGGGQELQASYTRRINRPNFFQLIPFADYTDELNITQGNPGLKPEFTNSLEATYSKQFARNNNLLISAYYKQTDNLITRYLTPGTNPFTGKDAIINTFINANESKSYGMEFTSQNNLAKWWDMTTNVNLYNAKINSDDKAIASEAMWSWFGKWNSNFKLPKNFTVQLSATYQSKTQLTPGGGGGGMRGGPGGGGPGGGGGFGQAQSAAQGYIEPFYGVDIAIRKNFLKNNAASATLSVNDIFRSRTFNQYSESAYFTQTYSRLRDPQMVRLTFTYRFGKMDATLFKRKNNNTGSEGGQMQM